MREAGGRWQEGENSEQRQVEGGSRGQTRDRGGGHARRRVTRPPQQAAPSSLTFNDRATYAETRLTLLAVEHDYSYNSMKNWQQVLSSCDPGSHVFKTVNLDRGKISILVRFGLYPVMRNSLLRRVKEGGVDGGFFTLGTDECVVKHMGIQKHMDIHVRYFNETSGRTEDAFIDTHAVGHAPADKQVEEIMKTLMEAGLSPAKVVGLSRDNPTVMKAVARQLKLSLSERGNPALVDLVCFLHPTHTAFEKLEERLGEEEQEDEEEEEEDGDGDKVVSISGLLSALHSFMNSTARREDMTKSAEELVDEDGFEEDLNQFFKRHVVTRWLEMEPCLKRLLSRWRSTVHYFTDYLPNSQSPTDKQAQKTDRFKTIYNALKPSQEHKTKAKVKFLQYICKLTLPFLTTFQASKPMVHLLYTDSTEMFETLARLIMKPIKFNDMVENSNYSQVDFYEKENLLPVIQMSSLSSLITEERSKLSTADTYVLLYSMRGGLQKMLTYLQSHLPLDDHFYKCLGFLHPAVKNAWPGSKLVNSAKYVASQLNRFDEEDQMDLQRQLEIYQSLRKLPDFDQKSDRVDEWWVKVWEMMEQERGDRPSVLVKLVKMCCVLSHSQAWVERGFNISKRFATDRECLNLHSMKALKTVHSEIKREGGAEKVVITPTMLIQVSMAGRDAKVAAEKEKRIIEEKAATEASQKEAAKKRKAEEDSKKDWEATKKDLEAELKSLQRYIDSKTKFVEDQMSKQTKSVDPYKIKDLAVSIRLASEDKNRQAIKEREVQEKLRVHMGKKNKKLAT